MTLSTDSTAATAEGWAPMIDVGNEPSSGLYYERIGKRSTVDRPVLWIHGGGATGACWRTDLRQGPGWADRVAVNGVECWVTDWPGSGRSGGRLLNDIVYDDLTGGYLRLLEDVIAEPTVIVCHSMGGAITWQLVQHAPSLVAGVVAVAASYPGNTPPSSTIVEDDGRRVTFVFNETGVKLSVDRERGYLYEDAYVHHMAVGASTRMDPALIPAVRNAFVPFSPTAVLQRAGVIPGLPMVDRPDAFRGLRAVLIAGEHDPAHTHEIESRTADLLRSWGAEVELLWLPDHGISGNGHMLFWESNAEEIGRLVEDRIRSLAADAR